MIFSVKPVLCKGGVYRDAVSTGLSRLTMHATVAGNNALRCTGKRYSNHRNPFYVNGANRWIRRRRQPRTAALTSNGKTYRVTQRPVQSRPRLPYRTGLCIVAVTRVLIGIFPGDFFLETGWSPPAIRQGKYCVCWSVNIIYCVIKLYNRDCDSLIRMTIPFCAALC